MGWAGSWPGNSQPRGRATFHQARSRSSRLGESMTLRSLPPLPCSTRMIMRLLSMSETLSETTSAARSPATVGHAQRRLVLQSRGGIEQPRHYLRTEHHRQLARLVNDMGMLDDRVALQRDPEEESQRRDRLVDGRHANTARGQMELV